ncbi:MAG: TRAP transporter substrate-binding protein DctP [Beijerinckiaceae bacterium]|nr:TRAP transporter substrate-binding protein DctP [Beijerinckiaceae bacterium]
MKQILFRCRFPATLVLLSGLVLSVLTATQQQASAVELVYGTWASPRHSAMRMGMNQYLKAVNAESKGAVTWNSIAGGQLVDGKGTLQALQSGLIDGGFVIAPYTPSHLPASALVFNSTKFGSDSVAAAGAMNEVLLMTCPECISEAKRNGIIQLGSYAATPFVFMCRGKPQTLADLKGKKIRSVGGGVPLVRLADAIPVAMSPAEATQALQRGALDCVHGAPSFLVSFGYIDVVHTIFTYPLGIGGPTTFLALSRKKWSGLSRAQKAIHVKHAARFVAQSTIEAYMLNDEKVLARAKQKGIALLPGGKDFDALVDKRLASMDGPNVASAMKFGVKNPKEIVSAYARAFKKWQGLSKDIGTDVEKFSAALTREIYGKLDPDKI